MACPCISENLHLKILDDYLQNKPFCDTYVEIYSRRLRAQQTGQMDRFEQLRILGNSLSMKEAISRHLLHRRIALVADRSM
jgi:hypothetical protein